ncbi:MAG: hemolysin family protein [Pseudomonadota bacterium]
MGDTVGDSSSAAHGAHVIGHSNAKSGFLSRLGLRFGARHAPVTTHAEPHPEAASPHGMGNLRLKRVEDVMIPRVEITAVPVDIDLDSLVAVFQGSGNTRLPVYNGTLDEPLGLIHLKDFALRYGFSGDCPEACDVRSLVRPLLFAPPSMPIGVLLQKMQTDRSHMALVIDEYGGVDGLVTIEDLIEQVIGEIEDEHDTDDETLWTEEKPGCYTAASRTPLTEFQDAIGLRLVEDDDVEEIDTLGGLVFMKAGRVPARGEVIPHPSGVQFEVVDADPRRIKRLRVRLPGAAAPVAAPLAPSAPQKTAAE